MSLQPAFDQINAEAFRRGLNWMDAEISWYTASDGCGVHVEFEFPDGTVLKGYAPDGMKSFEAPEATETWRHLTPIGSIQ